MRSTKGFVLNVRSEGVEPRVLLGVVSCWTVNTVSTGGATSVSSHDVADFSQELFSGWRWGVFVNAEALVVYLVELIDWCNDDEVDHCRDDQEVDNGGDDNTEVNESVFIVGDLETKTSHIGGAERVDDWLNQRISNRGDRKST